MEKDDKTSGKRILEIIRSGLPPEAIGSALDGLDHAELLHSVLTLKDENQRELLAALTPHRAASLVEEFPDSHTAELIEEMPAGDVASIVEELISYPPDQAGGLMMTEFASYPMGKTVREVVEDLTGDAVDYQLLTVHYVYVVVKSKKLKGVIRLRDLVFADPTKKIGDIVTPALTVSPEADLEKLEEFFDAHDIAAVPVVDSRQFLLGIVRRRAVLEALAEKSEADHLKAAGIIGGDELRSMPVLLRSKRRLAWLSINIVLNIMAASVIAFYEDTLTAVIALAVFLPIVSDMSGCSGNQAVAVSMRELTLGAAMPRDVFRVWRKEAIVGLINGLALGCLLGLAAWAWKGNPILGLVVGGALAVNTVVAVSIGGTVPLILKRLKLDPAVASGPLLTTVTDMCGFMLLLGLASMVLPAIS